MLQGALGKVEQKATGAASRRRRILQGRRSRPTSFAAANNGDILPLAVFAVLFALALTRISATGAERSSTCSKRSRDALLVIIDWVLVVAPLGVFALAFTVGSAAGGAAFAGLGHYVVMISVIGIIVTLAAYPLAMIAGRVSPGRFRAGMIASAGGGHLDPFVARLASGDARRRLERWAFARRSAT